MRIGMAPLFVFFLRSFLFGCLLGAIYDVFRILRLLRGARDVPLPQKPLPLIGKLTFRARKKKHPLAGTVLLCAEDILFCLVGAALYAVFLYAENDGIFRPSSLLALVFGALSYRVSIGRGVMRASAVIVTALRVTGAHLFWFLSRPFVLLVRAGRKFREKRQNVLPPFSPEKAFCFRPTAGTWLSYLCRRRRMARAQRKLFSARRRALAKITAAEDGDRMNHEKKTSPRASAVREKEI